MRYFSTKDADVNEVQMAMLLSMISSYMGGKSKPKDFILSNRDQSRKQSRSNPMETFAKYEAMATEFKGS